MNIWQGSFMSKAAAKLMEPYLKMSWEKRYTKTNYYYDFGRGKTALVSDILYFDDQETEQRILEIAKQWQGNDYDLIARRVLEYIKANITYKRDITQWNEFEYWQTAQETLDLKTGDCEDGAILAYKLCRAAGIPAWRLHLTIGDVNGGGHCWLQIISPNANDFINVDWCYYSDQSMSDLLFWNPASENSNYVDIWCSFNEDKIYKRSDSIFKDYFIREDTNVSTTKRESPTTN